MTLKENSLLSNTIETFKTLIGYDLATVRVVFEYDGDEIVFINEFYLGRVRMYLNGQLAYSGWDWTLMPYSKGWFLHKGKTYRVKSTISNLLSCAQKLTLSIDDEVVETKSDAFYGRLTLKEIGHVALGALVIGLFLASVVNLFGA